MFDLDYVDDEYTVDAAHYGNISHFVNHSVRMFFVLFCFFFFSFSSCIEEQLRYLFLMKTKWSSSLAIAVSATNVLQIKRQEAENIVLEDDQFSCFMFSQ